MRKYILLIGFISILGFFTSCNKEGEELVLSGQNIAPTLTLPNLSYTRINGGEVLTFTGTEVNPGYKLSAKYYLEACAKDNNFETVTELYSGNTCDKMEITVGELNQKLLQGKFTEDIASTIDFRLRAALVTDAGTGAKDYEYSSTTQSAEVTPYGLLRLDLINSGITQKIVSPAGDGTYNGFVKLNSANAFTLTNPEDSKSYGGAGGTLVENGNSFTVDEAGWYNLTTDINALTYNIEKYFIGCVGSATPDPEGWDTTFDEKMDYDSESNSWKINLDLVEGAFKFRKNDSWNWNMGFVEGETPTMVDGVMKGNLQQGGLGNDIPITEAGNYDITFTILSDTSGTFEIVKK